MAKVNNIVLVHGFWVDGSSYGTLISKLQEKGYEVFSVQNPLTSLADDINATDRVLDRVAGQCILVGHSWGGMVITEVGNRDNVSGLVYLAALAPDAGESMVDLMSKYETQGQYFVEKDGFTWISKQGVREMFAADLTEEKQALIYATQLPPSTSLLTAKVEAAAWKNKPSWYMVANNDKAVPTELQHELSQRMGAKTVVVESSHVPMMSRPVEVIEVIEEAAANS